MRFLARVSSASLVGLALGSLSLAAVPALAQENGVSIHLYGKGAPRPGRKMGHVNRIVPRG